MISKKLVSSWEEKCRISTISWFDIGILTIIIAGGLIYFHNIQYWGVGYVGGVQYGDAQFWWDGALHVAQGIFQDNPGKGYRPGYFIFSGLTLPVLGLQFRQYYPYFMIVFLTTCSLFYLALRSTLGRWAAACVVGMLVFNPFTAEWVATSTTDATGLLLNMAALACLLIGINNNFRKSWLIAFGVLFSLATLTRPLMTPFIGLVLLALLFIPEISLKKRLGIVMGVFLAFCLPTFLWMGAQKLIINEWSVSSNDASAFYAASDPNIQVWSSDMYKHISKLAAERNHLKSGKADERLINQTFWQETVKNYIKYPKYHLSRILPHVWVIAKFSPGMSTHGTNHWRTTFLLLIALGMAFWLLFEGFLFRPFILVVLAIGIIKLPTMVAFMTLAGVVLALIKPRKQFQLGMFLLSCYWLTGVAALYLVGGTWGAPSFAPTFALNALGYRLGAQMFFVGDLLASYFLVWVAFFQLNLEDKKSLNNNRYLSLQCWWQSIVCRASALAGGLVLGWFALFGIATIIIYAVGTTVVAQRAYSRSHSVVELYPSLNSVVNLYKQHNGSIPKLAIGEKGGFNAKSLTELTAKKDGVDLIFTGAASTFIWNLEGQQRAQLMIHTQKQVYPFTMGPVFAILEVPQHVSIKDWDGVQGAFIIRQLPDKHNVSNLPYYLTTPTIRAFVPLASDGKSFDLTRAVWFPLVENATQLDTEGKLKSQNAKIMWAVNSGPAPFQRRFFIEPKKGRANVPEKVQLLLDVSGIHGSDPSTLSFAYAWAKSPAFDVKSPSSEYYDVKVNAISKKGQVRQLLLNRDQVPAVGKEDGLKKVEFQIPVDTKTIEITFSNLMPKEGIWLYEFNLKSSHL